VGRNLDLNDKPDIGNQRRQRLQEGDTRYQHLLAFLRSRLSQIGSRWSEWRRKHKTLEAWQASPSLAAWLSGLPDGLRDTAAELIARLSALPIDNQDDRRLLYRQCILAFERMKLRGSADAFVAKPPNVDQLLSLLADRDSLEAALYRDIVRSRLDTIREFRKIVDQDPKERVLQKYLFEHLWLLDPGWERASGSALMERRLTAMGVIVDDASKKEELGRVELAYRTSAGKHIIIELKKAGRQMKVDELFSQGVRYVDTLQRSLLQQGDASPNIEVVFVLAETA